MKRPKMQWLTLLWQWDLAIFCCLGWDDQHLLPYVIDWLQGFLGDLARSLGKNTTLDDVLQTLDEHYGIVMIFITLSKELCCLQQVVGENVAKFGVQSLQQVQILHSEYPGRIQPEHIEELKWDYFYEGLNPEYNECWPIRWMVNTALSTLTCS